MKKFIFKLNAMHEKCFKSKLLKGVKNVSKDDLLMAKAIERKFEYLLLNLLKNHSLKFIPKVIKKCFNLATTLESMDMLKLVVERREFLALNTQKCDIDTAIVKISKQNRLDILESMMKNSTFDVHANNGLLLYRASLDHRHTIMKLILNTPGADPSCRNNQILSNACRQGFTEVVKIMLNDPRTVLSNEMFHRAAGHGHLETVDLLLKDGRIDPSSDNHKAVALACRYGRFPVVERLLQDERVNVVKVFLAVCKTCNQDLVKKIIENFNIIQVDILNRGFINACFRGEWEVANYLMNDTRANIRLLDKNVIDIVSSHKNPMFLKQMLQLKQLHPPTIKSVFNAIRYGRPWNLRLLLNDPRIDIQPHLEEIKSLAKDCPVSYIHQIVSKYIR